jgi:hypothetical protein
MDVAGEVALPYPWRRGYRDKSGFYQNQSQFSVDRPS